MNKSKLVTNKDLWRKKNLISSEVQEYFIVLSSLILTFMLQFSLKYSQAIFYDVNFNLSLQIVNMSFICMFLCVIRVFSRGNRQAFQIALTIITLFSIFDHYVELARGYCIGIADIFNIKSALNVAGGYNIKPDIKIHLLFAFYLLFFELSYLFISDDIYVFSVKNRIISFMASIGIIICLVFLILTSDKKLFNEDSISASLRGYNVFLIEQSVSFIQIEPDGYKDNIPEHDPSWYTACDTDENKETNERPNVVVVMNESFADLSILGDLKAQRDPIPYIHSLKDDHDTYSGFVNVYVQGSNTTNTEYAALSGYSITMENLNITPYRLVKNGMLRPYSIAENFNAAGYHTVAIHNYKKDSYYRNEAYPLLGFDECKFMDDLKDCHKTFEGTLPADSTGYDEVISILKDTKGPVFSFYVTVQNHGGYEDKIIEDPLKTGWNDSELSAYLSCIEESDKEFKEFMSQINELQEDTIVVFFGDHQPYINTLDDMFDTRNADGSLKNERFMTPVVICSNYGLDCNSFDIPEKFMIQYLPAHIVDVAKAPINKWLTDLKTFEQTWSDNDHIDVDTQKKYKIKQYHVFRTN